MSTRFRVLCALLLMLCVGFSLQASPNRTVTLNGQWNLRYWPQPDMDEPVTDPAEIAKMQANIASARCSHSAAMRRKCRQTPVLRI